MTKESMTSRERLLTVLANRKPDRLPCCVHGWQKCYLEDSLGGMDDFAASEYFGLDMTVYRQFEYEYDSKALRDYTEHLIDLGKDADGNRNYRLEVDTPHGKICSAWAENRITSWHTEYPVKTQEELERYLLHVPVPARVGTKRLDAARMRLKERGILRSFAPFRAGQGSPWQSFCMLTGTERAIFWAMDDPKTVHDALEKLLEHALRTIEKFPENACDLIETGGGAGSSTVISPAMFEEFCLPYDRRLHAGLHERGFKCVYHLCGGMMPLLEMIASNGADGLETMTPPEMGGDCDLKEASRRIGSEMFFIGGFNQHSGFETGGFEDVHRQIDVAFEATRENGAYIISPSDHFFAGKIENIKEFADYCKNKKY